MSHRIIALIPLVSLSLACSTGEPVKEYPLRGQVTAVKADVKQIVIKHEAVEGYMDAMTMPFLVEDESLLADKVPGDLVEGTLVVQGNRGHLKDLKKVGHVPLESKPPGSATAPTGARGPLVRTTQGGNRTSGVPGAGRARAAA